MDSGWIQAVAEAVQAMAVVFVIWQVVLLRRQIDTDHERSRRVRAIDDLNTWISLLDKAQPAARRLVDSFSSQQCACLIQKQPFHIASEHVKTLEYALVDVAKDGDFKKTEDGVLLSEKHLGHLLYLCISHLNALEVVLQGWLHGISDKKIIEGQFGYVVSFKQGHYILERLRQHDLLKDNYPAISAFVTKLRQGHDSARSALRSEITSRSK